MLKKKTLFLRWIIGLCLLIPGLSPFGAAYAAETALDRYVARPDPNYRYTLHHTQDDAAYVAYFLKMTSQQWRSASEVDRTIWEHEVIIVIPRFGLDSTDTAVLLIDGGNNGGTPMDEVDPAVGAAAAAAGAVLAIVRPVSYTHLDVYKRQHTYR